MTSARTDDAGNRAVYDNLNSIDDFERELDFVLTRKVGMVIIEPETLGELTWRWIRTGNWLHKTAVVMSLLAQAESSYIDSVIMKSPHITPFGLGYSRWWWLNSTHSEALLLNLTPRLLRMSLTVLSAISATAAGFLRRILAMDPCCKYQVASSLAALAPGCDLRMPYNGHTQTVVPSCMQEIPLSPHGLILALVRTVKHRSIGTSVPVRFCGELGRIGDRLSARCPSAIG
ncbi:Transmembrane protein 11 [Fasciola gigantica]|uniref:Transmembrane protein 11 n=1 Tax=Fasciola gigantica TaxID=46835 RepID=A0A504YKZ2_FASGI|nr:Transmembrane protein 11 [Fasciola gigantica]